MGLALNPSDGRYQYIYVVKGEVERTLTVFPGNIPPLRTFLSRALGRVTAHELAHLLLRTREHTDKGLLKPSFTQRDLESSHPTDLYLSPQQVALIRETHWPPNSAADARTNK